jgi:uncharacterized protein YndB with AHSA1/START domain
MTESSRRRSGFLVLADISGYTAFLTGTELEHAQGIIEDLTRAILASLTPPLTLVKLEGDAVFAHSPADRISGDRILDLVERTYCEFADCRENMQRNTTCTCTACANIPSLDLKFLVHHGEYLTHSVGGVEDLAGPDVILVHRLLKNDVRDATGCGAYALLTDAALATMPGVVVRGHTERTPDFGEVMGGVLDLGESLCRVREARRIFVELGEADFEYAWHLPVSPAEAWDLWTNPSRSRLWQSDVKEIHFERNRDGRQGVEGVMHCAHGAFDTQARYLDWRPFAYYSAAREFSNSRFVAPPALIETLEFIPTADGATDVLYRARTRDSDRWTRIKKPVARRVQRRLFAEYNRRLHGLLAERVAAQPEDSAEAADEH